MDWNRKQGQGQVERQENNANLIVFIRAVVCTIKYGNITRKGAGTGITPNHHKLTSSSLTCRAAKRLRQHRLAHTDLEPSTAASGHLVD